jgi:hypothetical protein
MNYVLGKLIVNILNHVIFPALNEDNTYMLSGGELIDTENISLPIQNMKFRSEWAKRTSHKLQIIQKVSHGP